MFSQDGTGIKLVERHEVWLRASAQIEEDFNEKKMRHAIVQATEPDYPAAEETAVWQFVKKYVEYAILSHTWLQGKPGEITYTDWNDQNFDKSSAGYAKITSFCRVAATEYGQTLGWMDTLCIDKNSSSELDESIRSMNAWYQCAVVCVAYLAETRFMEDIHKDRWFTRGWTLQELIAPPFLKFYSVNWTKLHPGQNSDKAYNLTLHEIHKATTITTSELVSQKLWDIPISRRMQWAAQRHVTREEDSAYSLMGIFDVSITTAYGEGAERAFVRLVKELLETGIPNMLDIVNWGYGYHFPSNRSVTVRTSDLIPSSPALYKWCAEAVVQWYRPTTPVTLTQLGLRVPVLMMPAIVRENRTSVKFLPYGGYSATADVVYVNVSNDAVRYSYNILDGKIYGDSDGTTPASDLQVDILGVLNIMDTPTDVYLQKSQLCYALPLNIKPHPICGIVQEQVTATKLLTIRPVTFHLTSRKEASTIIPKSELKRHGMTLRTMYL